MIEQLFGSKTRVGLLKFFFDNQDKPFFVRELTRQLDSQINAVRRELDNLLSLGIIKIVTEPENLAKNDWEKPTLKGINKKKYYQLDRNFVLFDELLGVFSKGHLLEQKELMNKLRSLDKVQYLAMTGYFTGMVHLPTDMLIIGSIDKASLTTLVKEFEAKLQREINYTIMTMNEFEYRKEITDKFLYDILMNPKMVVIDNLGDLAKPKR